VRVIVTAILARAVQDDVVRGDDVAAAVGDTLDRGLERRILERLDLAAVVAHEVVVMVSAGVGGLEARHAVAEVDPLDEPERVHALERSVDARDPDPRPTRARLLVELVRGEAAVLLSEELYHERPRAAASPARVSEARKRDLGPGHGDNDTRSQRRATVGIVRALIVLLATLALAGCGNGEPVFCPPVGEQPEECRPRIAVASFYPLAWATEEVAGASIDDVVNLTPPGAEPHDLELSPGDVETIRDAELVVYIGGGFQPALEDAIEGRDGRSLNLLREGEDPHIWLDPIRFAQAVERIARGVGGAGSAYDEIRELKKLDAEYRRGLRDCDRRVLVTTHAAFGQLARRYGLTELSLAGRSPEVEPSPRELEELIGKVRESGATTVFAEPLVSDRVAETVAREAGATVATLDPVEGLSEERLAAGEDYLSVMRANLAALREALGCR
jgi:zinc transport system substrate-binding protein